MEEEKKSVEVPVAETGAAVRPNGKPVLSDPMAGRDTDTGNLEILTDTATRRTVKLKPIAPQPVVNPASRLSITPIPAKPAVGGSAEQIAAQKAVLNTVKPSVAATLSDEDKTVKVQRMPRPSVPFDSSADKATVKLPPPRRNPLAPPPPVKQAMPATMAAAAAQMKSGLPASAPSKPLAPAAGEPTAKLPVMDKPLPPVSKPSIPTLDGSADEGAGAFIPPVMTAPGMSDEDMVLSKGCTIMQVFSTILVACAVLMMTLQFVDILCGTGLSSFIPGMSFSK